MKSNTLITAERLKEIAEKVEKDLQEPVKIEAKVEESNVPKNETLEQMAVRELLQDAKKEVNVDTAILTVPVAVKPAADAIEVFFLIFYIFVDNFKYFICFNVLFCLLYLFIFIILLIFSANLFSS